MFAEYRADHGPRDLRHPPRHLRRVRDGGALCHPRRRVRGRRGDGSGHGGRRRARIRLVRLLQRPPRSGGACLGRAAVLEAVAVVHGLGRRGALRWALPAHGGLGRAGHGHDPVPPAGRRSGNAGPATVMAEVDGPTGLCAPPR